MAMLDVTNLGISFGGLRAVDAFEVHIEKVNFTGLSDLTVQVRLRSLTCLRVFINQQTE